MLSITPLGIGLDKRLNPAGGGDSGNPAWTPDALASLQAWYDADALEGAADSGVETWTDRMGAFDAANTGAAGTMLLRHNSLNGRKQIEFPGGSGAAYQVSDTLLNGATAGAAFAVMTLDADPPSSPNLGSPFARFGTHDAPFVLYSDGNIYENFGTNSRKDAINPGVDFTSPRIYSAHSGAGDYRIYVDATARYTSASNTVSWTSTGTNKLLGYNGSQRIDGKIAEILIFNAVLSTADREKVEGYLAHKWGLTANLPALHPYKTDPPAP